MSKCTYVESEIKNSIRFNIQLALPALLELYKHDIYTRVTFIYAEVEVKITLFYENICINTII